MQRYDKPFDVSFRVGFNSALPLIHQFTIDDIEITDRQIHYKVGYLAAVTFSVNFNRFTLQPSVSWYHKEAQIRFALPLNSQINSSINSLEHYNLDLEGNSLEVPILVGYHVVKEGPYGMSIKFGPKGIYHIRPSTVVRTAPSKPIMKKTICVMPLISFQQWALPSVACFWTSLMSLHCIMCALISSFMMQPKTGTGRFPLRGAPMC